MKRKIKIIPEGLKGNGKFAPDPYFTIKGKKTIRRKKRPNPVQRVKGRWWK